MVVKELFDEADSNKDGMLTLDEFKDFCALTMKAAGISDKVIRKLQTSGDYGIWKQLISDEDINNDKELTWDEVKEKLDLLRSKLAAPDGILLHKDMPEDEYKDALKSLFEMVDVNGDKELEADEFNEFMIHTMKCANLSP